MPALRMEGGRGENKMNEKQIDQWNWMVDTLKTIRQFQSPEKLQKNSEKLYGLQYVEALEMSYENMQGFAASCLKKVRRIARKTKEG